jgi:CRISPR-associated protein Cas2
MVLVSYDVSTIDRAGRKRLRTVARECQKMGQRVQNSVFECKLDPAQFERLRASLESIIDEDTDSLRYYLLGSNWQRRVIHVGDKPSIDPDAPLIA